MKQYKVIKSNYDKQIKISTVTIATPEGLFTGSSRLSAEDADIESSYAGCRNAETRAILKWLTYKYRMAEAAYDSLKKLDKQMRSSDKFSQFTYEYKHVNDALWHAREKKEILETQIKHIKDNYLKLSDYHGKMIRSIREVKNK